MLGSDTAFGFVIGFTDQGAGKDPRMSPGALVDLIDASHIFQVLVASDLEQKQGTRNVCRCPIVRRHVFRSITPKQTASSLTRN